MKLVKYEDSYPLYNPLFCTYLNNTNEDSIYSCLNSVRDAFVACYLIVSYTSWRLSCICLIRIYGVLCVIEIAVQISRK